MTADWEKRFGAIRRAKDRALLVAVERRIAAEERQIPDTAKPMPPAYSNDMRAAIAKAFGRPMG